MSLFLFFFSTQVFAALLPLAVSCSLIPGFERYLAPTMLSFCVGVCLFGAFVAGLTFVVSSPSFTWGQSLTLDLCISSCVCSATMSVRLWLSFAHSLAATLGLIDVSLYHHPPLRRFVILFWWCTTFSANGLLSEARREIGGNPFHRGSAWEVLFSQRSLRSWGFVSPSPPQTLLSHPLLFWVPSSLSRFLPPTLFLSSPLPHCILEEVAGTLTEFLAALARLRFGSGHGRVLFRDFFGNSCLPMLCRPLQFRPNNPSVLCFVSSLTHSAHLSPLRSSVCLWNCCRHAPAPGHWIL